MNESIFHISDISAALYCPKRALLYHQKTVPPTLHADTREFHALIDELYKKDKPSGAPWDSNEKSLTLLEKGCGCNVRFEYKGIRCTIPVLERLQDGTWMAIYPFASKAVREHSLVNLMLARYIARQSGIEISVHELVTLNPKAVREHDQPVLALLQTGNQVSKSRGGYLRQNADELIDALEARIPPEDCFAALRELFADPDRPPVRCKACTAPSKCVFYEDCWHESSLKDESAAFFAGHIEDSKRYTADLTDRSLIGEDLSSFQYAQIMAARNKAAGGPGIYMDIPSLKMWMDQLKWPLCFLDFEWETFALPPYAGMKPFDVLCFQYSLLVEQEDGTLSHHSFFESGDCRKDFIESLIEAMPSEGSIVVFNLEGAEKLRLMQLANQFEEYRKPLEALCERMIDLCAPFENGAFYDLRQRGKCSLKTLLPLFSKVSYSDLEVHNGMDAVYAYRQAQNADPEKAQQIAEAISEYCAMDTYAEYELLQGLCKTMEDSSCQV